jgi:uncharacterized delta-60 repeat protein
MLITYKNYFFNFVFLFMILSGIGCKPVEKEVAIEPNASVPNYFIGLPDPTFGDADGSMSLELAADIGTFKDNAWVSTIQSDHKILIAGWVPAGSTCDGLLKRLNPDGTPDTTFNGTGQFSYNATGWRDMFLGVSISNNKIFAFGYSRLSSTAASGRAVIIKLNMDGTMDAGFATNGLFTDAVATDTTTLFGGEVLPDGKVLALGSTSDAGILKYFVIKLNADGSYDTSFGVNGKAFIQNSGNTFSTSGTLKVDSQGRIVAYYAPGNTGAYKMTVARLNSNGSLDTSFGTGGITPLNLGDHSYGSGMVVTDQAIYTVGSRFVSGGYRGFVAKLNSDGTFASGFADNGVWQTPASLFTFGAFANDVILHNDRIYYGGAEMLSVDATVTDYDVVIGVLDKDSGEMFTKFGADGFLRLGKPSLGRSVRSLRVDGDVLWAIGHTGAKTSNQSLAIIKLK